MKCQVFSVSGKDSVVCSMAGGAVFKTMLSEGSCKSTCFEAACILSPQLADMQPPIVWLPERKLVTCARITCSAHQGPTPDMV